MQTNTIWRKMSLNYQKIKTKNPRHEKNQQKINSNEKCSCMLNLLTLTPNVHPKEQLSWPCMVEVIFLMRSYSREKTCQEIVFYFSSKCSITSKRRVEIASSGAYLFPDQNKAMELQNMKGHEPWPYGRSIWTLRSPDGTLDPLTNILFCSLPALTFKLQLVPSGHSRKMSYSWEL